MKNVIPFTKEIKFENKISEITSISLEENYNCTIDTIDGEFIISGEYRSHELSINTDNFEYKLPFSVDLIEKIIPDTLDFEITDFSYDILNDDTLKVNIEFKVDAELEDSREELITNVEEFLNEESLPEIVEIEPICEDIIEIESIDEKGSNSISEEKIAIETFDGDLEDSNRIDKEDENTIIDSINQNDDEFMTYHIHIVKESETVESICALYNSNLSLLAEYNDLNNFKVGEKLIVVEENE